MKTKMTTGHFEAKILPLLQADCKTAEDLQAKAVEYLKDIELTDDDGKAVDVANVDVKGAFEEPEEPESKADDETRMKSLIDESIKTAIQKHTSQIKIGKRPSEIEEKVQVVSRRKRYGAIRNFKGKDAEENAYRFGMWGLSVLGLCLNRPIRSAMDFCKKSGIPLLNEKGMDVHQKVHLESNDISAAYAVPDEWTVNMIDLRLQYGVFRRNANVIPMQSDTYSRLRRTAGTTAYFVGENTAGTESTATFDRVTLTAKKLMVLSTMSNEFNADAAIDFGDWLAGDIAYQFSNKEDDCGFNGDGTATYGGMRGVRERLKTLNGAAPTTGSGLVLGAGNAYSELTLANFHSVIGCCPTYARARAKWYASPIFNDTVMQRLAYASGGVTAMEVVDGVARATFLGYPVELTEIMPTTEANSQVCALFGDLALAADFGDRASNTISFSEHATIGSTNMFAADSIAIRGTQRFDINVHDIGSTTVGGPIVGLITAAS